jgi:hypothetical protein
MDIWNLLIEKKIRFEYLFVFTDSSRFRSLKTHRSLCKIHLPSGYILPPCRGSEQRNQRNRISGDIHPLLYN